MPTWCTASLHQCHYTGASPTPPQTYKAQLVMQHLVINSSQVGMMRPALIYS